MSQSEVTAVVDSSGVPIQNSGDFSAEGLPRSGDRSPRGSANDHEPCTIPPESHAASAISSRMVPSLIPGVDARQAPSPSVFTDIWLNDQAGIAPENSPAPLASNLPPGSEPTTSRISNQTPSLLAPPNSQALPGEPHLGPVDPPEFTNYLKKVDPTEKYVIEVLARGSSAKTVRASKANLKDCQPPESSACNASGGAFDGHQSVIIKFRPAKRENATNLCAFETQNKQVCSLSG